MKKGTGALLVLRRLWAVCSVTERSPFYPLLDYLLEVKLSQKSVIPPTQSPRTDLILWTCPSTPSALYDQLIRELRLLFGQCHQLTDIFRGVEAHPWSQEGNVRLRKENIWQRRGAVEPMSKFKIRKQNYVQIFEHRKPCSRLTITSRLSLSGRQAFDFTYQQKVQKNSEATSI